MAVVSKAVFEKLAPDADVGDVLAIDRYESSHKALEALEEDDSKLFLFTVRPPKEKLWLVALLGDLAHKKGVWIGKNEIRVTDITALKSKIKFASGAGIKAKKGALGMSLQTPRGLTDADVALLEKAAGVPKGKQSKPKPPKRQFKFTKRRTLDPKAILELDSVHQSQFIEAQVMYSGTRHETAKDALDASEEANGYPISIELWDVIDLETKKPVFEYWVQGAGDGAIFEYGTDSCDNWLGSTQHRFESHGDQDEVTLAIVRGLQEAGDRDL